MATTYTEGKVIHHDGEAPPAAAADETKTANVPDEGAQTAPAARSPRPKKTTAAKAKRARKHKT